MKIPKRVNRVADRSAFTLIELLAVVAILLLLLSMLFPALKRAREMAMDVRYKSNLRQMATLAINYAQDHQGVLPSGGSRPGEIGTAPEEQCWMGKEVLAGSMYANRNFQGTPWPVGNIYGTLFSYLGNDVELAKKLYRCIALPTGVLGSGEDSNGYFDYALVKVFSGATIGHIPTSATLRYTANAATWQKKPTPLIVEEDPD